MNVRCTVLAATLMFGAALARADDLATAARPVFEKNRDAVISVNVVLEISMAMGGRAGGKNEQKLEISGTVIREDGLTVASLAALDPAEALSRMAGRGDRQMTVESKVKDVKLRRPDGTEVPGRVVLRDKDLDLAFLVPTEKGDSWSFIDLTAAGEAAVLDPVVVIQRLGQVAVRTPSGSIGRISALIEKPRKYYVMDHDVASLGLGVPVFATNGKLLGLMALRSASGGDMSGMNAMFSGASSVGMIPVIRPASQVKDIADQASEAIAKAPAASEPAPASAAPADATLSK